MPERRLSHGKEARVPQYFQFWIVLITVPNAIIIALMVLVFALLVLVPIPRHVDAPADAPARGAMKADSNQREAQS